ncbi:TonB-dependent receptor [Lysobacter pythonis]|uniref:TonB-dependent receptor n=1 Tax=Solilutibacter pythonis TaxID=2483112 RepID=A0A3M2I110_9GAMM|nr:TonB-dependent receptor [Lysobacter pythonis]RMH92852.1 TonB-dependent receptor [Lysobacter pythonis]
MKPGTLGRAIAFALGATALPASAHATDADPAVSHASTKLDNVIVTGTRGSQRTQFDTMAPVDVFSAEDIQAVESVDLNDVLAQLVPSFVVQRLPMNDGLVFVRPATLRGLSPDQTLVLVNGRRFHRSAFLGARGAQGADLARIPVTAVKRIEVLRDGASAQYGSDAIAGVINIILDDATATELSARVSQYSAGDGKAVRLGGKTGFALGDTGHVVLFAEGENGDATSRSRQRADAIAFQNANPDVRVPNPVQRWGQPDLDNRHLGFNLEVPLAGYTALYGYGIHSTSKGVSDFNWRNPDGTPSVYRQVAEFPGWDLRALYPAGFSPKYGSRQRDTQLMGGVRGEFNENFRWDVSASWGRSAIRYTLGNTINASLGPQSPTFFQLGQLSQEELNLNADFVYSWELAALPAPLNVAFGAERRSETFGVKAGDAAAYAVGPGAASGLSPNSNGAPGYSDRQAGKWTQRSLAAYLDVEAPLTERWNLGGALRYENFSTFGGTLNGKLSTRLELSPALALRGAWSTGFRAPTPGQVHSTNTVQGLDTVTLQVFTSGRLSPNDPLAIALGAKPLGPEKSRTLSLGMAWRNDLGFSGSVDVYDIKVTDRFSQSPSHAIPAGMPNPMRYSSVSFFTNDFDTTTRGVDVIAGWLRDGAAGKLNLTAAWNYNRTRVDRGDTGVASNATQRILFEERLPRNKATLTADFDARRWGATARLRHYGAWTDSSGNASGDIFQRFGAIQLFDLALRYRVGIHQFRLGADNLFDTYPDEATFQASRGLVYSRNAPYDTDGRNLYLEYRVKF